MLTRDPRARIIAALLWLFLWVAVLTVVIMTWHPWVVGARAGCPPGQRDGWDGRCRPAGV
jgi:hypothetical protein